MDTEASSQNTAHFVQKLMRNRMMKFRIYQTCAHAHTQPTIQTSTKVEKRYNHRAGHRAGRNTAKPTSDNETTWHTTI